MPDGPPENREPASRPLPIDPQAVGGIAVFHLVRAHNQIGPLHAFLGSYREHVAGVPHELVILFKGFPEDRLPPEYQQALDGIAHRPMFVQDVRFDIATYLTAARACDRAYLFFLNSFSVILGPEWLAKFFAHAASERVGTASATGSWGSPANTGASTVTKRSGQGTGGGSVAWSIRSGSRGT